MPLHKEGRGGSAWNFLAVEYVRPQRRSHILNRRWVWYSGFSAFRPLPLFLRRTSVCTIHSSFCKIVRKQCLYALVAQTTTTFCKLTWPVALRVSRGANWRDEVFSVVFYARPGLLCHILAFNLFKPLSLVLPPPRPPRLDMRRKPADSHRRRSLSDPLSAALLPPPNETPLERERRLHAEFQAKQVSDGIDEMIRKERFERKKTKTAEVKVLLLGQSESGKSTTLKREYCHSTRNPFRQYRESPGRVPLFPRLPRSFG
jgi:hypothetical protein